MIVKKHKDKTVVKCKGLSGKMLVAELSPDASSSEVGMALDEMKFADEDNYLMKCSDSELRDYVATNMLGDSLFECPHCKAGSKAVVRKQLRTSLFSSWLEDIYTCVICGNEFTREELLDERNLVEMQNGNLLTNYRERRNEKSMQKL